MIRLKKERIVARKIWSILLPIAFIGRSKYCHLYRPLYRAVLPIASQFVFQPASELGGVEVQKFWRNAGPDDNCPLRETSASFRICFRFSFVPDYDQRWDAYVEQEIVQSENRTIRLLQMDISWASTREQALISQFKVEFDTRRMFARLGRPAKCTTQSRFGAFRVEIDLTNSLSNKRQTFLKIVLMEGTLSGKFVRIGWTWLKNMNGLQNTLRNHATYCLWCILLLAGVWRRL